MKATPVAHRDCSFCSHRNAEGAKFCSECGSPLRLRLCRRCEAINDFQTAQCHMCGELLDSPQDAEQTPAMQLAGGAIDSASTLESAVSTAQRGSIDAVPMVEPAVDHGLTPPPPERVQRSRRIGWQAFSLLAALCTVSAYYLLSTSSDVVDRAAGTPKRLVEESPNREPVRYASPGASEPETTQHSLLPAGAWTEIAPPTKPPDAAETSSSSSMRAAPAKSERPQLRSDVRAGLNVAGAKRARSPVKASGPSPQTPPVATPPVDLAVGPEKKEVSEEKRAPRPARESRAGPAIQAGRNPPDYHWVDKYSP